MRRQRFVFLMCVLFALIAVVGIGCKNQFLEKPTFGSSNVANNEQATGPTTGSVEGFGAPSGLKSTQGGYREITLSWNPVQDAVRYYVYRANTQFETFIQVGETGDSSTSYTMKVQSGADFYYRVTAVNHAGEESRFSTIVRGTSLAQPLVSGIEGVEGKEDSDVTVYWYMGNVDAYQKDVRYNVICYDEKGTELARVVVDGSKVNETAAVISGLIPNTSYTYAVEAYVVSAQDKVEKCNPIDAATARRLRPNAPENLVVQQGQSKDGITLSFNLPALVDVALPGGVYEQYPLYFKIYRREASSSNTDTGWQLIKADFGKTATKPAENENTAEGEKTAESEVQKVNFGAGDVEYNPGDTVTFTDQTAGLKRGTKYEYKVQSFAYYERDITSQYSASVAIGWLIDQANFRTGKYTPTLNEEKTAYVSATLGFSFEWKTLGLDNEYHFILEETRFTLEGDSDDASSVEKETIDTKFNSIAEVNAYVRKFNNLNDGTQGVNVRGYYRYTLTIFNKNNTELLVLNSPGRAVVTHSVNVPVIKLFTVSSGYNDKIELQWMHNSNYTYTVEYIDTDNNIETVSDSGTADVPIIDHETLYEDQVDYTDGDILTYTHNVASGTKYEYILRVSEEISTDSLPIVGRTSVAPKIEGSGYSYDSITVTWQDVPAADFTIAAKYKDSNIAGRYPIEPLQVEGHDAETVEKDAVIRTATFDKPNGYTHGNVSGLPVEVTITANVPVTRTVHELDGDVGTSYKIKTEPVTSLALVSTTEHNTVGPAMVQAKADEGIYSDKINLTWKEVPGATAYMVLRSGFHIASDAPGTPTDSPSHLDFQSTDTYLVKKSEDKWTVSLMPSGVSYDNYFSVSLADGTFTLSDNLYTAAGSSLKEEDKATMGQWIARQEQLSWGAPYKYSVLPVTTENEAIEYDYESSPSSVAVASINLTELPLVIGTTKGYAWNVKATKGTYSKNGENTGVKLTWTRPFTQASQEDGYNVYRAEYNSDNWVKLDKSVEYGTTTYVDESATPGVMYQYMVATGVTSDEKHPNNNVAWVARHDAKLDENYEGERLANGFTLPRVSFTVTRQKLEHSDASGGKEKLTWNAQSVAGKTNYLFDGYIIELLNHNISGDWQQVAKLDFGGAIQKGANYTRVLDNSNGLLKVLRDYKHYFRIRTYTLDEGGNEVVSKDDYQWADGYETEYVKWGARSLSADEWIKCATLAMSIGLERAKNNRSGATANDQWSAAYGVGMNYESLPGSGSSSLNAFGGLFSNVYHQIKFNDFKPAMTTKSGKNVAFLTIKASSDDEALYGETYDAAAIRAATDFSTTGSNRNSTPKQITIMGPSDVPGLYDAKITFYKFNPVRENGGGYVRLYPGHDSSDDNYNFYTRNSGSNLAPFPCNDNGSTFKNDEWK